MLGAGLVAPLHPYPRKGGDGQGIRLAERMGALRRRQGLVQAPQAEAYLRDGVPRLE